MSEIMGEKVSLKLVRPERCRVLYQIVLSNEEIGTIELDQIAWRSGEAELKIAIPDPEAHNHGYGTDAVSALVRHAFVNMSLKRVYLRVHADNESALRCYEKAGFKKEGRLQRITDEDMQEEILLMGVTKTNFLKHHNSWAV